MKIILSWRRCHCVATVGIFLITAVLIAGPVGCGDVVKYDLTVASSAGGLVTIPGEGAFAYDEGEVVNLEASPDEYYHFVNWTGDVNTIGNVNDATTTITMDGDYSITADFAVNQYDLTITSTEGGSVTIPEEETSSYDYGTVIDLVATPDSGYQFVSWTGDVDTIANVDDASATITINQHRSITANFAKEIWNWSDLDAVRDNLGGSYILVNDLDSTTAGYGELAGPAANGGKGWQPIGTLNYDTEEPIDLFTGSFDGQGYEIAGLFIDRPDEDGVGLFGGVGEGVIENLGLASAEVTGHDLVGGLAGDSAGAVSNSYCTGTVNGHIWLGSLVGRNGGTMSNSYFAGSVIGEHNVGGLVGGNYGTVGNSYSDSGVTGSSGHVGGLVGWNHLGTVSNCYFTGSVTGGGSVGGLVGEHHDGTVNNSYYSYDEVLINGRNIMTIGALPNEDFEQWLANDKSLDVNERLSQEDGYYLINDVGDFKQLLAFGQNDTLKFKLTNDLDLGGHPNFYVPYLAGEFDGSGHKITNVNFSFDDISQVGLFGYLASGGAVTQVSAENVNITGNRIVGALVGENDGGTLSNSYATGRLAGHGWVGGLVGWIGWHGGTVSNSYYDYDEVLINGANMITIGALPSEDFEQWLANARFLDISGRLSQEDGHYLINDAGDFKQLLAFGQNDTLKFKLTNDLDLGGDPNFYVPYLAGEFDGSGHKITNLRLNLDFVAQVGLFGYLACDGKVNEVCAVNVNIAADALQVGGLVGSSSGTIGNSYCTGSVIGDADSGGGLVGWNDGTVSNSYSTSSVAGSYSHVGGLIGWNYHRDAVSNSFWDTQTSGQSSSAAGTGKTTAEMQDIATFTAVGWNIVAVANPGARNTSYIWNIVDGQTYPFLSWQSVS